MEWVSSNLKFIYSISINGEKIVTFTNKCYANWHLAAVAAGAAVATTCWYWCYLFKWVSRNIWLKYNKSHPECWYGIQYAQQIHTHKAIQSIHRFCAICHFYHSHTRKHNGLSNTRIRKMLTALVFDNKQMYKRRDLHAIPLVTSADARTRSISNGCHF